MNALTLALAVVLYFLPSVVAFRRQHKSAQAIALVNIFLGWTLVGWLWALVWSYTGNTAQAEAGDRVPCPQCMEPILAGAKKCKHCGSLLAS